MYRDLSEFWKADDSHTLRMKILRSRLGLSCVYTWRHKLNECLLAQEKEKKGRERAIGFFFLFLLFTGYNYILKGSTKQFYIIGAGLAAVCVT